MKIIKDLNLHDKIILLCFVQSHILLKTKFQKHNFQLLYY